MADDVNPAADRLEQVIQLGAKVERFLNDPDITRLFEKTRADIIAEWERADTPVKREAAHASLTGLSRLQRTLKAAVDSGEHTRIEVQRTARRTGS